MSTATFVLVLMFLASSGNSMQTVTSYNTKADCEKAGTQFTKSSNSAHFVCISGPPRQ